MIYSLITGDNTLLFFDGRHQIASINFKSQYKLYKYLKLCTSYIDYNFNDYNFNDFLDDNDLNYNTLTLEDIKIIINKYDNYLYDFNQHIKYIERR